MTIRRYKLDPGQLGIGRFFDGQVERPVIGDHLGRYDPHFLMYEYPEGTVIPEKTARQWETDQDVEAVRSAGEYVLPAIERMLTEGLVLLAIDPFPVKEVTGATNRRFDVDPERPAEIEAREWLQTRLRRAHTLALEYAEERRKQGLPVVELPTGVALPAIPER